MIPLFFNAELRPILLIQIEFYRMRFSQKVAAELSLCFSSLMDFPVILFSVLEYTYNNEKFTPCQENIEICLHVNIFISAIHQIDK